GRVSTIVRATRYHRADAPSGPAPAADTNSAAGNLWNGAGFALVVVDARGTGASFGARAGELGEREIDDYGEVIAWVAAQPWSNGRVGVYGTSYEGQAAELVARLRNPHLLAVAALFSPLDPYRQLFYPGGSATEGRFARWMGESQLKDGVVGALERLAALTGRPPETIRRPSPAKPVDGPEGQALLEEAIGEHQANTDVGALMSRVPFRDDRVAGLDWEATAPASSQAAIESTGVPMLVRAGWLDGAFAAGALVRFATFSNHQEVEIGPWGHGGETFADPLCPGGGLDADESSPEGQDRRLVEFFSRYLQRDERPEGHGTMRFSTLGTGRWQTVSSWPPEGLTVRRWYPGATGGLTETAGPAEVVRCAVDPTASSGVTNRWLAIDLGQAPAYPDRRIADEVLRTFTTARFPADLHVLGFPLVSLRLATSGSDGAVYVYLEDIDPDGEVTYLTEGCLRFLHRQTSGPAEPARLGVPRTFSRADALPVGPGQYLDLPVELLPVSALLRAGHQARVAIAGHDAACFARYGPGEETFTLELGEHTYVDLPVVDSPPRPA
ncbi:MAG: CocE/NonD family hydrolase, partial [Candidatus Dormiibacterota bacterium]